MVLDSDLQKEAERWFGEALERPISDEQFKAIGQVVVRFNRLEHALQIFIWLLLGVKFDVGEIITSGLSFRNLLDIFSSLCRHLIDDPNVIEKLRELCKQLGEVEQKRNQLIHSQWWGNLSEVVVRYKTTARARKGRKTQFEFIEDEYWTRFFSLVDTVEKDLIKFHKDHLESIWLAKLES